MDPHLRWLRRLVVARTAERVAVEAGIVGLAATAATAAADQPLALAVLIGLAVLPVAALARVGLALTTNPITHRYLLWWTDPSIRLRPALISGPARADDPVDDELRAGSFTFQVRLERIDQTKLGDIGNANGDDESSDNQDSDAPSGLDVYRAEGGRLVATRSDDDEITVISRLEDGRALVTSAGFVPPTARLVVQRAGTRPGQITTDLVIGHVERLLALREAGIEAIETGVDDVIALARAEWEAWQEIGPFVGPLIAVGWRRWPRLGLQVDVPDELVRERAAGPSATASRTRSRAASD